MNGTTQQWPFLLPRQIHEDHLTTIAEGARVAATEFAFALWSSGSPVVTWGAPEYGGDSSNSEGAPTRRHHQTLGLSFFLCGAFSLLHDI